VFGAWLLLAKHWDGDSVNRRYLLFSPFQLIDQRAGIRHLAQRFCDRAPTAQFITSRFSGNACTPPGDAPALQRLQPAAVNSVL
jgi:hypothetical protein